MAHTLGSVTFDYLPDDFTMPRPQKSVSVQDTYSGVVVFSWGVLSAGQRISLKWDLMSSALFDLIDAIYAADANVVWNPDQTSGVTYTVSVLGLDGKLFAGGAKDSYRTDVVCSLVILAAIPAA